MSDLPNYQPHELTEFINHKTEPGRVQEWDLNSGDDIPLVDFGPPEQARDFAYRVLAAADYIEEAQR